MGVTKRQEVDVLKMELETVRQREHVSREMRTELEGRVEQLAKENDSLREQHLNHVRLFFFLTDAHSYTHSQFYKYTHTHRYNGCKTPIQLFYPPENSKLLPIVFNCNS